MAGARRERVVGGDGRGGRCAAGPARRRQFRLLAGRSWELSASRQKLGVGEPAGCLSGKQRGRRPAVSAAVADDAVWLTCGPGPPRPSLLGTSRCCLWPGNTVVLHGARGTAGACRDRVSVFDFDLVPWKAPKPHTEKTFF